MNAPTAKPLDLAQFEGHTPKRSRTHAQIAADARKPYAEVILKKEEEIRLLRKLALTLGASQAALAETLDGPKFLYDECVGYANDQRALMVADRQTEMAADAQFDPRGE